MLQRNALRINHYPRCNPREVARRIADILTRRTEILRGYYRLSSKIRNAIDCAIAAISSSSLKRLHVSLNIGRKPLSTLATRRQLMKVGIYVRALRGALAVCRPRNGLQRRPRVSIGPVRPSLANNPIRFTALPKVI